MTVPVIGNRVRQSIRPGDKKHYLTIVSEPFYKGDYIYYKTICDCGNQSLIQRHSFGKTKSCGCLAGEREEPLLEIPSELKNVRSKLMKDKKLLVFENGTIFRIKGNFYFKARQFLSGGRNSTDGYDPGYPIITYSENGKQVHKTVHRLVGKAFLVKAEGKNEINHKDGNKENNHVSNLEWVTRQENITHAYETGLLRTLESTPHKCPRCNKPTISNGLVCADCREDFRSLKRELEAKQRQRDLYKHIDTSTLKPRYKKIIESRSRGETLDSIGKVLGCTREYVRQLEKKVLDKEAVVFNKEEINSKPLCIENEVSLSRYKITLRAARANVNLSAKDVANKLGKSINAVVGWEVGRTKIPLDDFKSLINIYKVPLELLSFKRDGNWIVLKEET